MNKIIKDKWLKALRSGKYKQGDGCLKRGDYYCCLGVLCEITGNAKNRNMNDVFPIPPIDDPEQDCKSFMGLTPKMQEILASLNDNGFSFKEIAAYISRNVKTK